MPCVSNRQKLHRTPELCFVKTTQNKVPVTQNLLNDVMKVEKEAELWFRRMIALIFFPQEYIQLTGLLQPPQTVSMEGQKAISDYITYFTSNWMRGQYEKKWNKFMIMENRTTNLAENYHSRILSTLGARNPTLEKLLSVINDMSYRAYNELKINKHALRKPDQERRDAIEAEMKGFFNLMKESGIRNITREQIYAYLDKMTRFIPTLHI